MPLGNNLKKRKLLPEKPERASPAIQEDNMVNPSKEEKWQTSKPQPSGKKATGQNQKKHPNTNKNAPASLSRPKKGAATQEAAQDKLSFFITQEVEAKKKALRQKYREEIAALPADSYLQFVIIHIGEERYAIEIDKVREIVPLTHLSKTPQTHDHVLGIAKVRGKTRVVFDLKEKFGVKDGLPLQYLLVFDDAHLGASLALSTLPTTLKILSNAISHGPKLIEEAIMDASYIKGLIHEEKEVIYYLDIIEMIKNEKAIVVPDEYVENTDES